MTQSGRLDIYDVSTTKRNGDGEQEEIGQTNSHTKLDILQRNRLMIRISLYLSTYFDNEY